MQDSINIQGIALTSQKIIRTDGGEVLHGLKKNDDNFYGFGEAYFSTINYGEIKGWKRHSEMVLNIVVPIGKIKFVVYDDRLNSATYSKFQAITISRENYLRLTLQPMLWFAFQGLSKNSNILLNIANIEHGSDEVDKKDIGFFTFEW